MSGVCTVKAVERGIKSPLLTYQLGRDLGKLALRFIWVVISLPFKLRKFRRGGLAEKERHEFILDHFKPIALSLGALLDDALPDPALDKYPRNKRTEFLIGMLNWYLEHEELESERWKTARGIGRFIILLQEYNSCYGQRLDALGEEWLKRKGQAEMPQRNWKHE